MVDLPAPDSPMRPMHLAALAVQRDVVDQDWPVGRRSVRQPRRAAADVEDDRVLASSALMRPLPGSREWIDSIQSTTKLTPMVRMAIAAAGISGAADPESIMSR